ncbi:MAG TPA: FAD-dependent oxidoreductase, partial [Bacteroidales bacterium]|nr:FAD-dependent oxidoreductase [Bacteroidales bacterium]
MKYNIIIIGAGPAGYIAAIRAGQLGMKVLLADREKLGGMCINWGCIPAKSLLESVRLYSKVNELADFGIEGIKPSEIAFNWSKAVSRANSNAASLRSGIEFLLHKN